ncbi:ATP-binding protein [Paenibacillus sp. Soil522]|uniref:ATP-binding protein n=1 Tax=Paenibacillus sp. Soil522 TaxID=1736388 RepID=UPI0006F2C55E|nr:ATP-binding protein [Paenibacillus sp. Soil522]KRE48103.1 hypothetical protein ASG81_07195 [Paenibacillus sp. Soil522]
MIEYIKDFLLNIFIIFSPLAFYPYIYKTKSRPLLYRFLMYIFFALAIITTMSFPVTINGLLYDFRTIPLAVGSLYGGVQVSVLLYLTLMLYRYLLGNPNVWIYILALLPGFVVFLFLYKSFQSLKLVQKIAVAVILCTLIKLLTFTVYLSLTGQIGLLLNNPISTVQNLFLQGLIVGLCVYAIEFLNKYFMMQEEIVRSEKMKIVGDMAASVAHEFRNPLTTVRGFIHLFGTTTIDKEKKEFYRKVCIEELDRAELIITDYLSLAKPDPEHIETLDVKAEIHYLSNVLLTYANYNNIQVNVQTGSEQPIFITGDRFKFRQALINIGKNAIEAMQDGGTLTLKTYYRNDQVLIVLSDNGNGMTPEQVKRLGTPYYSTKDKGTGLGTMVSFSMIKKMNGKIDIRSEIGKGTEFMLAFSEVKRP